jgi:hypothetical protein
MNLKREEFLFALALEKPVQKHAAFLHAACDDDPALRARLESLLAARSAVNSTTNRLRTFRLEREVRSQRMKCRLASGTFARRAPAVNTHQSAK